LNGAINYIFVLFGTNWSYGMEYSKTGFDLVDYKKGIEVSIEVGSVREYTTTLRMGIWSLRTVAFLGLVLLTSINIRDMEF
jgi:hypothetical protein